MSATTHHAAGDDQVERGNLEREAQLEMQGYMAHLMKEAREREVDAMLAWWKRVTSQPHLEVTKMAMRLAPQERQALLDDLQAAAERERHSLVQSAPTGAARPLTHPSPDAAGDSLQIPS